jgi:hypothetical protein
MHDQMLTHCLELQFCNPAASLKLLVVLLCEK